MHILGEILDRGLESKSYRAHRLTLLTAAITLWDTVYIERALIRLSEKEFQLMNNTSLIYHHWTGSISI